MFFEEDAHAVFTMGDEFSVVLDSFGMTTPSRLTAFLPWPSIGNSILQAALLLTP